jgi:hypothetical protein
MACHNANNVQAAVAKCMHAVAGCGLAETYYNPIHGIEKQVKEARERYLETNTVLAALTACRVVPCIEKP